MTHRRCSFDSQPCPFDRSDPPLRLARHSQPHSHTMARSAAATSLLSQVLVVLLLLAVAEPFLSPVSGSNICICECCDGSSCLRDSNATFAIGSCNDCTLVRTTAERQPSSRADRQTDNLRMSLAGNLPSLTDRCSRSSRSVRCSPLSARWLRICARTSTWTAIVCQTSMLSASVSHTQRRHARFGYPWLRKYAPSSCGSLSHSRLTRFCCCVAGLSAADRDSGWNKATIIIFLITLAALIVLGCARNHSPALQKLISSGNTNH